MMLHGVESALIATAYPLEHPIPDVVLLLADSLSDYRFGVLQFLFVVVQDALHIGLGLAAETLQLVVEDEGLLFGLQPRLAGNPLNGLLRAIIDQAQRGWVGQQRRQLLLKVHGLLGVNRNVVLDGDLHEQQRYPIELVELLNSLEVALLAICLDLHLQESVCEVLGKTRFFAVVVRIRHAAAFLRI